MQRIYTAILLLIVAIHVSAKVPTEGIAVYKQSINIHASIPESQAAMKAFIPEFQYMEVQVSFKNNLLRFKSKPIKDDSKAANVQIKMAGNSEDIVIDTDSKQVTQYGSLMDIDYYLIQQIGLDDSIVKVNEEQTINGYLCKKAVDKMNKTVIWYHENDQQIFPGREVPTVSGLIVKVEGEQMSYELLSIKAASIEEGFFDIPKDHQEITYEQFVDLQEESMEEMQESMGGQVMRTRVKH